MNISTTETLIDRQKQAKTISEEIAQLKRDKETLTSEVATLVASREGLIQKTAVAPEDYRKIEDEHIARMQSIETDIIDRKKEISDLEERIHILHDDKKAIAVIVETYENRLKELLRVIPENEKAATEAEQKKIKNEAAHIEQKKLHEKEIAELQKTASIYTEDHAQKMSALETRHTTIMEEERLLSIKRSDLEIYETRLRKKYPDESINV